MNDLINEAREWLDKGKDSGMAETKSYKLCTKLLAALTREPHI